MPSAHKIHTEGNSILDWKCLKYMSHSKNVPALEFWTILCSPDPSDLHYGWQPANVLGGPEAPRTNVWEPWELPPTMPSGPPMGGWEELEAAKTLTRIALLAAGGEVWDYGGRLWRDCGADMLSFPFAQRYSESSCLACAAGVSIKQTT